MKFLMPLLLSTVLGFSTFAQSLPYSTSKKVIGCFEMVDTSQSSVMYFELLLSENDAVESALALVLDLATGNPVAGDDLAVSSIVSNGAEITFQAQSVNSNLNVRVSTQYARVQTYTDENGQNISVPIYDGTASISDTQTNKVIALICSIEYI